MPGAPRKSLSVLDLAIILSILALAGTAWVGFLSPDPFMVRRHADPLGKLVLWGARAGIPFTAIGIALLYAGVRTRLIPRAAVVLVVGSACLGLVIAVPMASYWYNRSFQKNLGKLHPYLQLDPPAFRPREPQGPRPFRIFCLGGSTTEWTDSKGRGWPERLEKRLENAVPGRTLEVHNLGRMWYTTLHSLINYQANLRPQRPDVLIVMHAINDLLHNADFSYFSRGPFRADYGHFYGPIQRLVNREPFLSHVATLLRDFSKDQPRTLITTAEFPGLAPFERNLRTLIQLARLDGTRVVLMTEPHMYKPNPSDNERAAFYMLHMEAIGPGKQWSLETARRGMEAYNELVRRVAEEEQVFLIDLERVVPKRLEYFKDDVHYQDKAFDLIAEALSAEMTSRLFH